MSPDILSLVPPHGPGVEIHQVRKGLANLGHSPSDASVEIELKKLARDGKVSHIGAYWWGRR